MTVQSTAVVIHAECVGPRIWLGRWRITDDGTRFVRRYIEGRRHLLRVVPVSPRRSVPLTADPRSNR